jgi:hypothetical protein
VSESPPRRRVRVTSSRTTAARRGSSGSGGSAGREIAEQTVVGEVLVRSLVHAQLRLALYACVLTGILIGSLPLVFVLFPRLAAVHVFGVPLPWVLLGVAVYPGVCLGAWAYVRAAERNEADFSELVDRS